MSVDGEEAAMGDLGEVQWQPVDVNNADEGLGGDNSDLGMKGGSGEPQNDDGEANNETHNSDQASSTSGAQLTGGKCYSF